MFCTLANFWFSSILIVVVGLMVFGAGLILYSDAKDIPKLLLLPAKVLGIIGSVMWLCATLALGFYVIWNF